ncbi:bifunctional 2',3'-cyclic-nucleotide 2'-phosphodiesterase/3'-nucleotidase [Bacillus thuringiensis]|uniref:bifunctional 2',3'-cyclic-nucleotide 2'-phosphodiesterase/3'-nucleotidase n=1 Tax=Bacillus thuringiensis TaxID=1428 RepID=UPI000BF67010|nr:bifunctional 2',3'-cyclic-nucleotide 2'-phosphodiesterase/3'-nucleotidase [Bacillus thuringiensis]MCC6079096.1 bifunctional 2',3'-cyclic-nucleotide 2'-phosphodiesterase/3'-nucleotidase [Bacillus thuringiensis]PEQ53255.1 bifunctional 2',3'-cyclic-nucleotide 2'-phosphodiesterase/3'-nucleotidase [Bacillus thuringiensis]PFS55760.1 bifunctional 2',3'-cyclic-nucleotide 2'-phosphodiesterase/3'-nucleotidase [Bacillus thuringiensis]HDX9702913.1 bifunctional 2',3'-cyclic-nucleotide 2'-phosphodiesteras
MKKSKKMLAGATLAIGVIAPQVMPATAHADENTGESTVKLRILETSDIHVNLMNYDYYQTKTDNKVGLVQTATLVNKAREEAKNSVLFDDGDALQGTPLGDYVANKIKDKDSKNPVDPNYVHPLYRVMNLMKYDVISLGNHEFNYGLDYLKSVIKKTKFPVINSNVYIDDHDGNDENDKHYFDKPYHIFEKEVVDESGQKQKVKIGVMGFVPPQVMNWDKANLEGKVKAKDIVQTAKKLVPEMKAQGADIIVALAHSGVDKSGYNEGMENASFYLATEVPGVDAVLMGHSHTEVKDVFNGVPVVMPGVFGSNLGIIDMQLKKVNGKWEVQKEQSKPQLRPIVNNEGNVGPDQTLVNEIKDEHEKTIEYVNTAVGKTTAPINSYFSLVQDDPSVQIVTNAQKWYVEQELKKPEYEKIKDIPVLSAGAPFKAGGRNGATYYTDIPAGTLAIKNVADLYVYPNTLYAVKVNGAQVKEWLEMSAGQFNQIYPEKKTEEQPLVNIGYPTYNFDILDGLKYEIDVTQPAKYDKDGKIVNANTNRIVNMTYEGKPVADDQKFIVATNNYRGSSQTFPGVSEGEVVYQSQDETRQIIVKYMQKIKNIDPAADQNWTFKPIVADKLNTTFDSSPNAQKYIKKDGNISYVGPSENEFAKYAIDITKKNDDKETGGENPTIPPKGDGENPTPPTEEGNNGNEPKQDGNNTGSGQTTTDDQNTKETTTTVSENKEAEKDERDLPKTGASIASTIGAGLAFVGAGLLMLFRRKKANR